MAEVPNIKVIQSVKPGPVPVVTGVRVKSPGLTPVVVCFIVTKKA